MKKAARLIGLLLTVPATATATAVYLAPLAPAPLISLSLPNHTPAERGAVLRKVLATAATLPGTVIDVGPHDYDLGNRINTVFPEHVTIQGPGPGQCSLRSRAPVQLMCQFECSNGTVLRGLSLINDTPDINNIGVCAGFSQATKTEAPRAVFERCVVIGREHGGYNWGPRNGLIVAYDTKFMAGKWGFTNGSGSGPDTGARGEFYRCTFTSDTRLGTVGGDSGLMSLAFVQRGGHGRLVDCTFETLAYPAKDPAKTVTEQACVWLGLPEHRYRFPKPPEVPRATWASVDLINPTATVVTFAGPTYYQFVEELNSYDGGKTRPGRFRVLVSPAQKVAPTYKTKGVVEVLN